MPWRKVRRGFFHRRKYVVHLAVGFLTGCLLLAEAWLVGWYSALPGARIDSSGEVAFGPEDDVALRSYPRADPSDSPRLVYPYSVVRGGVRDIQELREAVSRDAVVTAHYSGFDLAHSRIVRLDAERMAYVAYRMGDRVFWTRKQVRLAKGEELITDGVNYARTRCGNRISDQPSVPTSRLEPSLVYLDPPGLVPPPPLQRRNHTLVPVFPIVIPAGSRVSKRAAVGLPAPGFLLLACSGLAAYLGYRRRPRSHQGEKERMSS